MLLNMCFKMLQIIIFTCFLKIESARILGFFSMPSISHQVVFRPLMNALASCGHEVVVITPDPVYPDGQGSINLTEINVHDISYNIWSKLTKSGELNIGDPRLQAKLAFESLLAVFEAQVKSPQVQKLIRDKNQQFDLVLTEACIRLSLSFSYIYNVPVIEISSLAAYYGTFHNIGSPTHPSIYPIANQKKTYQLTIWEKITELYFYYGVNDEFKQLEKLENNVLKKIFGPQIPDIKKLKNNVHMLFLNIHSIWDFNRPAPPNVLYLSGLHLQINEVQELPKGLKSFLNSSTQGFIYMSFGTNVMPSSLPEEKIKEITKVLSDLPYDVLWKWDSETVPVLSKNVWISKWFPQIDLLRHPKIQLFITQGGLQSTDEAIAAGVPLVVIPMIGDQFYNAEQYELNGIGRKLLIENLNENSFMEAIKGVIGNLSYRNNVLRLCNVMKDQFQAPIEKALLMTEYVLRNNGTTHLRPRGAHMSWTEYYEVNLILELLVISLVLIVLSFIVVQCIIVQLFRYR